MGETLLVTISELRDGSYSEYLEKWKHCKSIWHKFDCITFYSIGGVVLQCLVWDFEYTNGNILNVDASFLGML